MLGLALASLAGSIAAMTAAFLLWRRVRLLESGAAKKSSAVGGSERGIFESVELSLEAMLEELELKEREIMRRIERREAELLELLERRESAPAPGSAFSQVAAAAAAAAAPPAGADKSDARSAAFAYSERVAAVRRLADEGLDVVDIAKRLGMGKGEVALILDLGKSV